MRILGMGIPEMLVIMVCVGLPVLLIILIVLAFSRKRSPEDVRQRVSALAYQRLSQLDDLRKRGALSEEDYDAKKREIMQDL